MAGETSGKFKYLRTKRNKENTYSMCHICKLDKPKGLEKLRETDNWKVCKKCRD